MNSVLAKMAVQISANTADFNKAIMQSKSQLQGFEGFVGNLQKKLIGFGAGFSAVMIGREVIQSFANFQYEMSKVQAVTQATGADFRKLRSNAIDLGSSYGYTTTQVASLQLEFGRLGFSTKEILNSSKAAVLLAKATGEDLANSAQIAGSTLRAFGLDASEMNRVTDVMAAAFNKSALGLSDFGEAIKYVAPVAAQAGLSIEQVSAMLGVLADSGIKGSMAGTSLRKIISDLGQGAAPVLTKRLAEMAKAGLSGAEAMDEVGRTAYASLLVLSNNTQKINEAQHAYENANGELQKMADIMEDNLIGDWNKLTGAMDAAIQKMGEGKDSEARKFLQETAKGIQLLSDETLGWTQKLEILFSPNWEEKWAKWSKAANDAADQQDRLTRWDAQLLINKYNGIEQAIDGLNNMNVFSVALDKEAMRQFENKEAILEELNSRLEQRAEAAKRGLNKEAQAAMGAASAYRKFLEGKIAAMWFNKNLDTMHPILGKQPTPVTTSRDLKEGTLSLQVPEMPEKVGSPMGTIISQEVLDENAKRIDAYNKLAETVVQINERIEISFMELGFSVLEAVGTAIGGGENLGKGLLKALANFGQQYGKQLVLLGAARVAEGVVTENPDSVRKGLTGIAAGSALIVGSAALAASISSSGGGAIASGTNQLRVDRLGVANTQNTIKVEGRLVAEGQQLVALLGSVNQSNYIRKG